MSIESPAQLYEETQAPIDTTHPQIVLDRYKLWSGMRVMVKDKDGLVFDGSGNPLLADVSIGGDPLRPGLYREDELFPFNKEHAYIPVGVYSKDVPPGKKYAVFRDGEAIKYEGVTGEAVFVSVDETGAKNPENKPRNWTESRTLDLENCLFVKINEEKEWRPEASEYGLR